MTRELFWLTLTVILTGLLWVPYIINRCQVRGLGGAMANPSRNDKPHAEWANRLMFAHDNAIENLIIFAPLVLILNLERHHDQCAEPAERRCAVRIAHVAGGTGDIAFRAAEAAGTGFRATVCDINTDMLDVGRNRAVVLSRPAGLLCRGQCRGAGVWRPRLRRLHHRVRHSTCRGSMPRCARPIACCGPAEYFCAWVSTVDVPGLDRLHDFSFVQGDPCCSAAP